MIYKKEQLLNLISESIKNVINEGIGFGFSLGKLKSLHTFAEKVKYCDSLLGNRIGNGSSRICYQLDDNTILKLAKNAKGLAQNEHEGQQDWYRDGYGLFPKVYYNLSDEEKYTFLVSEYVLPVKEQDFKRILGIDSNTFYNFLETCASQYDRSVRKRINDDSFYSMIENNEDLEKWYSYMCDYCMKPYDLRNANFGMTLRDGEPTIVMLDSGLDEEIYHTYYKR